MARSAVDSAGRVASLVAGSVRESIASGEVLAGDFVPSVRELAREHSVDIKTALKAMKALESQGLLRAVRGRGFRVLAHKNATSVEAPIAYIGGGDPTGRLGGAGATVYLSHALHQAATRRGWCMIAIPESAPSEQLAATLKRHGVLGAIINSFDRRIVETVVEAGLPAVMVDSSADLREVDVVMQDGQEGGRLAAEFVLERGRKRVAWLGNATAEGHLVDRLSGATATLAAAGCPIPNERLGIVDVTAAEEKVREWSASEERPDAIIAPWSNFMLAASHACRALGLEVGKDLDVVGWCNREVLKRDFSGRISPEVASALVTWSEADMAETAVARLIQRREHPELPPLRIKIPTRLVCPRGNGESIPQSELEARQ
jgi:DNA-binding LacI/PurR family transcriptional regulator